MSIGQRMKHTYRSTYEIHLAVSLLYTHQDRNNIEQLSVLMSAAVAF
jgi:hypothetical protein